MGLGDFFRQATGRSIHVYADFMDPFCYIGFHQLRPLAEELGIRLEWHGFELNPDTPQEGYTLQTASNSDLRPGMWASVHGFALSSGLELPEPERVYNTRNAHKLVYGLKKQVLRIPLIERLYQAYFIQQKDIGDLSFLIDLAGSFEFSAEEVRQTMVNPVIEKNLETSRQEAFTRQLPGMPGFIYRGENRFGALSRDAWKKILTPQR